MHSHVMPVEAKTYRVGNGSLVVQSYVAASPSNKDKDQPAIFVLPAAGQNAVPFRHIGTELAQRGIQVHVLSLRGHAPSQGRCTFATFARYIEDIRSTMATLDLRNVVMVGHSLLGGCLAQEWARREPCAGLIVLNGCLPQDALHGMHVMMLALVREHPVRLAISTIYAQILFNRDDFIRKYLVGEKAPEALVEETLKDVLCGESLLYFFEVIRLKRRKPDLRPLRTSHVLSIVGEHDFYFPPAAASPIVHFYQQLGAHTTQHILPGAHHNSPQTHPELITQLVYEFWQACLEPR